MKAVYFDRFGGPEVLQYGDLPRPLAASGQVLLEVVAAAVNPADKRIRNGEHTNFFTSRFPVVSGWDVAGRIVEIGEGVTGWTVGDEVAGLGFTYAPHHGSYAEYMPIDASAIALKPPTLSFEQAAALPLVSLTAWQALTEVAKTQAGDTVFISAGAGGLGGVAIALAKHLGARVYTTTRAANFDYVRSMGADRPIDYTASSYVDELRADQPEGLDTVLELLDSSATAMDLCKAGGTAIYMNDFPPDLADASTRGVNAQWLHHRADGVMLRDLLRRYADGVVPMPHIEVMPLDRAAYAHKKIQTGRTKGKIVLRVQPR